MGAREKWTAFKSGFESVVGWAVITVVFIVPALVWLLAPVYVAVKAVTVGLDQEVSPTKLALRCLASAAIVTAAAWYGVRRHRRRRAERAARLAAAEDHRAADARAERLRTRSEPAP